MDFRYLGRSGLKISEVTYGNWLTHGSQVENEQALACVPDALDNGLALCALHHRLFDRGVLTVDLDHRISVSGSFTGRTPAARAVYELHGSALQPRRGTPLPAEQHLQWHHREVFKGHALSA